MPIDYNIPLGIKQPEINPVSNTLGRLMAMREMQDRAIENDMQRQQMAQKMGDTQTLNQAYQFTTREASLAAARKAGKAHLIPVIQKQYDDWDEAAMKRQEGILKAKEAEQSYMGRLFAGVRAHDYDTDAVIGAVDHAAQTLGPSFAPRATAIREQIMAAGGDKAKVKAIVDRIEREDPNFDKRQTAEATALRADIDAQQAKIDEPAKKAEAQQKRISVEAQRLAAIGQENPMEYARQVAALPDDLKVIFPSSYHRDRVLAAGQTADQRLQDIEARRTADETNKDRDASRNIAAGHLRVSEAAEKRQAEEDARVKANPKSTMSAEAKALTERRKSDKLEELRGKWDELSKTPGRYEAEELRIENEYRAQMGLPMVAKVPWRNDAPSTPAPPPLLPPPIPVSALPAPGGTLGGLMPPPAAPPAVAPVAAPVAPAVARPAPPVVVPKDVQDELRDRPPGILRDPDTGVTWRKLANGRIVRVD
jgi:hypothetical protein